jgi:predicted dehydrogenase
MQGVRGVPITITGVTSNSRESRERFAVAHAVKAYDSLEDLLAECDVADVCTPPYAHEEITLKAAAAGKHVIVEKPFTGSFLNREKYETQRVKKFTFNEQRYVEAFGSAARMAEAVRKNGVALCFAENWHFLPAGLKACRLMMRSMFKKNLQGAAWTLGEPDHGARVMLIRGSEAHSGSGSAVYGDLKFAGGGALMGKACHPLGFALYLKRLEGVVRDGRPITPEAVRGTCGYLTYHPNYRDPDYQTPKKVRRNYVDGEDWGLMVVRFSDGTYAEIQANEFTLGGVANTFEILSNKFRLQGNVSPNDAVRAYAPSPDVFEPEYLVEKLETAGGWSFPAIDENFTMGYIEEMQVFFDRIAAYCAGKKPEVAPPYLPPEDDAALAVDSVRVMYGAYVSDERKGAEVELRRLDDLAG